METKVYVDVLLVLNYIVNMLLLQCTAKLTGRRARRGRMVLSALFGAASALTIFLPFLSPVIELLLKAVVAAVIVLIAFSFGGAALFLRQLFVFFATSFFFGGVMLAIWVAFRPSGMVYYNGVVYFNISTPAMVIATIAAYGALTLVNRFSRGGRLRSAVYRAEIGLEGKTVTVRGLLDTGNGLYDPFTDTPVMVCHLRDMEPLLPEDLAQAIRKGEYLTGKIPGGSLPIRLIPYSAVGGEGVLPAFRPDSLTLEGDGRRFRVEAVYIGVTVEKVGGTGFEAILNPDLIGIRL